MKIVDKKKFIRSSSMTVIFILLMIFFLMNHSFSHTEVTYKKICISSGDTLWSIAKYEEGHNAYFEKKDIRDIVDEIKYVNHLDNSNLNVGDELTIPII